MATRLPANMGAFFPVVSRSTRPYCIFAVDNQVTIPRTQPETDPSIAPKALALLHKSMNAMGITADPMSTPIARYIHPSETPALFKITARIPMKHPNPRTADLEILNICLPVALGFM